MFPLKKMLAVSGISVLTLSGIMATRREDPDGPYKNLQVLSKNTSDKKMDVVMSQFNTQLGVTCVYCHVWRHEHDAIYSIDFSSDEKPEKNIARTMLRMSIKLNRKYFNSHIDGKLKVVPMIWCRTCHMGHRRPSLVQLYKPSL